MRFESCRELQISWELRPKRVCSDLPKQRFVLDTRVPEGPIARKWQTCVSQLNLVAPARRPGYRIVVVGAGLAGAGVGVGATLAEQGYRVDLLTIVDSPRRSHSVAAQGGFNAAKNYSNDGDSVLRMFFDTLRGGDFRSREASVYRLAELSTRVVDYCVAQGVPLAREYGGALVNRSFGGVQVSRTFYARGQTGQQLLNGVHGALMRQVGAGRVRLHTRTEMTDLVVEESRARGVVTRCLLTGRLAFLPADCVVVASGGYSSVYQLSTNAVNSNSSAIWRCHRRGAWLANPSFVQFHPTCIPEEGHFQSKLTLMSESLRNDGRVWVPQSSQDSRPPQEIPEAERDYYLERLYPDYGNLVPRDIASREALAICRAGRGVGPSGQAVYLDFADALQRLGGRLLSERYGNLFQMYREITGDDPYRVPMRISPAAHFSMGGLWVDYHLQSNLAGLFVLGEANFADHGANRLGANSLLQTLVDGLFVAPLTVPHYLAGIRPCSPVQEQRVEETVEAARSRLESLCQSRGQRTAREFHVALGELMRTQLGVSRCRGELEQALSELDRLRHEFHTHLIVGGRSQDFNRELEYAARLEDFLEMAQRITLDALHREESCGAHFRSDFPGGRDDERFAYVAAWEWHPQPDRAALHREPLKFEAMPLQQRTYGKS